jgi:hypothetical protein
MLQQGGWANVYDHNIDDIGHNVYYGIDDIH